MVQPPPWKLTMSGWLPTALRLRLVQPQRQVALGARALEIADLHSGCQSAEDKVGDVIVPDPPFLGSANLFG